MRIIMRIRQQVDAIGLCRVHLRQAMGMLSRSSRFMTGLALMFQRHPAIGFDAQYIRRGRTNAESPMQQQNRYQR